VAKQQYTRELISPLNKLIHLSDQGVDLVLSVAQVTTLNEMSEFSRSETTSGVAELEWPQEIGGLLEVGTDSENLVDQILHADNTVLAQASLDYGVVSQSNSLLLDLSVTTLIDELAYGLEVGISIGDPRFDNFQHLESRLGHANENTIVDLEKTEQLKDFAWFGRDLVDTLDTDNKHQLLLSWDVERTILLGETLKTDLLTFPITVFLHILFGTLEDNAPLFFLSLSLLLKLSRTLLPSLLLTLALLQESLRDQDVVRSWHACLGGRHDGG